MEKDQKKEISRRDFMKTTILGVGGLIGALLDCPQSPMLLVLRFNKALMNGSCAGYLTHPSVLWNSKHEFRQSTPIFPSTKMPLKDHFQENTSLTSSQVQPDLISWSSLDTIHPCSSGSDAKQCGSIKKSHTGITVM